MAVSEWSRAIAVAAFVASCVGLGLGRLPGFRVGRTGVAIIGAAVITAVRSNVASNVPAVLPFKPLVTSFGEPRRAWLVRAMASTVAGNLTILGSVANLIVVETARAARVEIGFVEYCKVGVPVTLATLLVGWALLAFLPA